MDKSNGNSSALFGMVKIAVGNTPLCEFFVYWPFGKNKVETASEERQAFENRVFSVVVV